eukprot:1136280-Pelagomonas_calceolata.AAC.4
MGLHADSYCSCLRVNETGTYLGHCRLRSQGRGADYPVQPSLLSFQAMFQQENPGSMSGSQGNGACLPQFGKD